MKNILFLMLLVCSTGYALETDLYLVEKPDGTVKQVNYIPGSSDSVTDVLRSVGAEGRPVIHPDAKTLPSVTDNQYWKRLGSSVIVDEERKQADVKARAEKEAAKEAVLSKLKISKEDFEKIK